MKANRLKHNSKWNSIQYWFWECTFEVFLCYYQSYDFSRHYATWNMNLKWKKFNQSQRWGCSMNMYDSKKYVWKNWIRWLRKKFGSTFFSRFCSIWILHFQRSMLSDIFLKHIKKVGTLFYRFLSYYKTCESTERAYYVQVRAGHHSFMLS